MYTLFIYKKTFRRIHHMKKTLTALTLGLVLVAGTSVFAVEATAPAATDKAVAPVAAKKVAKKVKKAKVAKKVEAAVVAPVVEAKKAH